MIVTRQFVTQVTLGRGLNRQERRLTQATSSRGISHVTGASNNLQLKVSSNGCKMRHTQTQAQQVTTLSTLRLRSQANQFLTQALVLRQNHIENVIIVGTKTNCCIRATVTDAFYLDYNGIVISDCVATNSDVVNQVHLEDVGKYLGQVMDSETLFSKLEAGEL